jgi:thiamine-monophosphate kinase
VGTTLTLGQLGERRIVEELVRPRFPSSNVVVGIGDDCAVLPPAKPDELLVFTTDPCPVPVICLLGETDFYHYGRMTVLINISDLAAMGARPLGLLISTVMPEDMLIADYERFLDGAAEASAEWSCPVVGGNIKDGPSFTATGSALGAVRNDSVMLRTGARPGDRLLVIGEMGVFWAAVLRRMNPSITFDPEYDGLLRQVWYRPIARIREGMALGESKLATSCMDSSDGVIGCLQELASKNSMDVIVEASLLHPHPVVESAASATAIDPRKLMLSWGDWQLVCTAPPARVRPIQALMKSLGTPCYEIAYLTEGDGRVLLHEENKRAVISNFASERFCATSFFTHGLDAYIEFLRKQPLTVPGE